MGIGRAPAWELRPAPVAEPAPFDLGPYPDEPGFDIAEKLDADDALSEFREHFTFSAAEPDLIYLDGNSLGRLPVAARSLASDVVDRQWGARLIRAWNEGWWDLQLRLGDLVAPMVGAEDGEVIISDSTSVNLYKLAMAAVRHQSGRHKIVTDDLNFPTDLYVLDGVTRTFRSGHRLEIVESDGIHGPAEALERAIDDDTALVSLSHTVFKSGYTYDMAVLSEIAHEAGALILWDLSHSVGVMPISLGASGADMAIGCTYKYLNGGPGAPAFLYLRRELVDRLQNPITAWWGHARPFDFELGYEPVRGIRSFHTGTMPILALATLEAGLKEVERAGTSAIAAKSRALTRFLIEEWKQHLEPVGFELATPLEPHRRGSHVSIGHREAWQITQAMIQDGQVLPDFRAPDNIRLGLAPLYTSFVEVHTAIQRIKRIVETGIHHTYTQDRPNVT